MEETKKNTSSLLVANTLFAFAALLLIVFSGCHSIQGDYESAVRNEFAQQPLVSEEILAESDITRLPAPVKKYLIYSGAVGKAKLQNFRLEFDAKMTKKPGDEPMDASSVQVNFFGSYTRIFFMKASKLLVPFRILHVYKEQKATFVVRIASLFNAVDLSGEQLTAAETVTVLNDLCVFAPGALVDQRLSWKEIDSLSAQVIFNNGAYTVSAILYFNEQGALINFISDDRYAFAG